VALGSFLNYRLDRPADGLAFYQQALRITPEHGSARHNLGIALRKLKRHDESLAAFDLLISQARRPTASMYNGRHYTLCELGRRDDALRDLERAVEIDANFADAWNNLGCERQYIGDVDGALAAFRRCMALDANHGYARKNEADLLLELGRASEALPIYGSCCARRPANPACW
jgi:tetratricopeptide (TPR) repeat protein